MCIWDGWPIQPESERESEWHDSEGDLPFLPDDPDDWRRGYAMGPEEAAFRKLIEDGEGQEDGS